MDAQAAAVSGSTGPLQLAVATAALGLLGLLVWRLLQNFIPSNRPPVFEGLPIIGGLLKFSKGPWYLMKEGYAKCGEVFTVPVAHKRVTFLIGPDVAPHFFMAGDDKMSQTEVYSFNIPTFGRDVVYDVDQKVRTEQFRFFTEALKKERLRKYVPQFVAESEEYFAKWGVSGVVDLQVEFSKLISLTAARTLLGREIREQLYEQVAELLHDLDDGMRPISVFFPYLPTSFHKRRDAARRELGRIFAKVIQARRGSVHKEEDVLQQFCDATYQNVHGGRQLTEEEITGLLIAVLFAGQHTSSITSSWTGYFMMDAKATAMAKAVEEQRAMIAKHGAELSLDVLQDLDVLHRNITEALRIHPPLILLMRMAKAPFSVTTSKGATHTIPPGDIVMASPNFSHMLPEIFADPNKYDPERFAPPREEDKRKPFAFIGFGGGRHGCIGSNFAYLQIKAIWSVLLRSFEFELLDPIPEPDYEAMVIGPKPCRVRYSRRPLAPSA